jgi:hypothetical protein
VTATFKERAKNGATVILRADYGIFE